MHTPLNHLPRVAITATALALLGASATPQAQQISVLPATTILSGTPLQIVITGMPPGAELTLQTSRLLPPSEDDKRTYIASARFVADAAGRVDLAAQAPLPGGSYSGADVRGLLWSMAPSSDITLPADTPTTAVALTAKVGGSDQTVTATIHLLPALPQVQSRAAAAFAGAVFAHLPGTQKRPALIVLGGSEGGAQIARAAPLWASRGFAVLALPYYSPPQYSAQGTVPPELPTLPLAFADIPIERLEQARAWLVQQPEVDATRIGVMGTSKGAEFALLAGSKMPWIKTVVAVVPSDVVWEGWGPDIAPGQRAGFAWKGEALPFVPYLDFDKETAGFATGAEVKIRRPQDKGRAANPDRAIAARIRVEDIAAPVLVMGAHDDQLWDSGGMALNIVATRQAAGRETVALVFDNAGHYLGGTGDSPTTQYNAGPAKAGGTPQANAQAQAQAFAATLAFLRRTLGPTEAVQP
jgi:BAAT / Acyl-CoA thioester hydrolase C terminal/Acyl-CoA thioester hydrolase/BAAT N-terminal region